MAPWILVGLILLDPACKILKTGEYLQQELVGDWWVDLRVTTFEVPSNKIEIDKQEVKRLLALDTMQFRASKTVKTVVVRHSALYHPKIITERVLDLGSEEFFWRVEGDRNGEGILYLYLKEQVFLVARCAIRDGKLWLAYSLEREKSKKEAPKTFDPYKENNVVILILKPE